MLKFESQDEVQVYAGHTGFICFKSIDWEGEEHIVKLTIGQFRKVIKNSEELILDAEYCKSQYEEEVKNETNS